MRLIVAFQEEKRARALYSLLSKENIESVYEVIEDSQEKILRYPVWIVNEEDVDRAMEIYEKFKTNPEIYLSRDTEEPSAPMDSIQGPIKIHAASHFVKVKSGAPLTRLIVVVCILIFLWNGYQKSLLNKESPVLMGYFGLTTLTMDLMYDVPVVFEDMYKFFIQNHKLKIEELDQWPPGIKQEFIQLDKKPFWKGFYDVVVNWPQSKNILQTPLFTKISEGEIWRLFTPALLHGNFLHILFNMLWLWLLGKEMELKIGRFRYFTLMLIIGVISNTAQYLVSGPLFLGYSGVICGLGGFIWMRQKKAPWEGYMIPKGTLLFLFIFVIGMVVLQTIALIVSKMHLGDFSVGKIGNTAHIAGLICGLLLARIPLFYRLKP